MTRTRHCSPRIFIAPKSVAATKRGFRRRESFVREALAKLEAVNGESLTAESKVEQETMKPGTTQMSASEARKPDWSFSLLPSWIPA